MGIHYTHMFYLSIFTEYTFNLCYHSDRLVTVFKSTSRGILLTRIDDTLLIESNDYNLSSQQWNTVWITIIMKNHLHIPISIVIHSYYIVASLFVCFHYRFLSVILFSLSKSYIFVSAFSHSWNHEGLYAVSAWRF